MLFVKVLRMGAELLTRPEKALHRIEDILELTGHASPFFQALAYGRVANALYMLGQDMERSKTYYSRCIEIGEAAGTFNVSMIACGELAALYLREKNEAKAEEYARKCLAHAAIRPPL